MVSKDLENTKKENAELKEAMSKSQMVPDDVEDSNQLKDKVYQHKSLKKDILEDLEEKSKNMRQTETQLKIKQNEMDILNNSHQVSVEKVDTYKKKVYKMEAELEELRNRAQRAERDKVQLEMESKNKIEVLQYKLLNKLETDDKQDDSAFDQLLNLCQAELEEILSRVKVKGGNSDGDEHLLTSESIEDSWSIQSKKLSQMKLEYEQEIFENLKKIDDLTTQLEDDKRVLHRKYKEDIEDKSNTILHLKGVETKYQQEIEKCKSLDTQINELNNKNTILEVDIKLMRDEKILQKRKDMV
eukprot:CAMPEP_0205806950 /NCGR_PEP_ID=MMETSP0205-20121125/10607_1 /ASSEMBLY_ACC=CAM_ASM_000278 /TAXON_ID=36767 /ORGANISM="Euplotes focardii, Strain TN1" /LENGTH=299 /DNA_ID=CAMNT_0053080547 /DNA_START=8 /DNA_END=906 /DNA_ORIENTATION=-